MFNIVEKRRWYFIISAILIGLSIAILIASTIRFGSPIRVGIDFTGGSIFVLKFDQPIDEDSLHAIFAEYGMGNVIIQPIGPAEENRWQIRSSKVSADVVGDLLDTLNEQVGTIDQNAIQFDTVEPAIGNEVTRAAFLAVLVASAIVIGFIWFSFRRVPNAFRYGVCTIIGMVHNLIVAFGFYALMGIIAGWEADALFLTAILTVIGFSVQDVIVVFDRIRENIPKYRGQPYETIVNRSIMETIHRSLATQLNAMFVMIAIILFGGVTIKPFIATMLVGMLSETFSSIFIAVPLLVVWENAKSRAVTRATA